MTHYYIIRLGVIFPRLKTAHAVAAAADDDANQPFSVFFNFHVVERVRLSDSWSRRRREAVQLETKLPARWKFESYHIRQKRSNKDIRVGLSLSLFVKWKLSVFFNWASGFSIPKCKPNTKSTTTQEKNALKYYLDAIICKFKKTNGK